MKKLYTPRVAGDMMDELLPLLQPLEEHRMFTPEVI